MSSDQKTRTESNEGDEYQEEQADEFPSTHSRNSSAANNSKKNESVKTVPKDKHSVSKRLQQELLSLMMYGEKGVSAFPDGDNLFRWIGIIQGPIGTVTLQFKIRFAYILKKLIKFV